MLHYVLLLATCVLHRTSVLLLLTARRKLLRSLKRRVSRYLNDLLLFWTRPRTTILRRYFSLGATPPKRLVVLLEKHMSRYVPERNKAATYQK